MLLKYLIYKEWIKTKWFFLISAIISLAVVLYIFVSVSSAMSGEAIFYLYDLMTGGGKFFIIFKPVPILIAVLIGLSQFIPEVTDKRIKLSLHLPTSTNTVIYSMVLYGFCVMMAILLVSILMFVGLMRIYFPIEIIVPALQTMSVWILGGVTTYFLIAMIALEPVWKFRFLYLIVAYFIVSVFMRNYAIGNVVTAMPIFWGVTLLSSISILFTSHRFNKGEL